MRGYHFHVGNTAVVFQEYPWFWVTRPYLDLVSPVSGEGIIITGTDGDYVQMVSHIQWLLVLMVMLWIYVDDFMQMLYSVRDHMDLRLIFWAPDLFTWRFIRAFDLGIPSMFRKGSTVSDVPEVLIPYNGRYTWYLVLICAETTPNLWLDDTHMV